MKILVLLLGIFKGLSKYWYWVLLGSFVHIADAVNWMLAKRPNELGKFECYDLTSLHFSATWHWFCPELKIQGKTCRLICYVSFTIHQGAGNGSNNELPFLHNALQEKRNLWVISKSAFSLSKAYVNLSKINLKDENFSKLKFSKRRFSLSNPLRINSIMAGISLEMASLHTEIDKMYLERVCFNKNIAEVLHKLNETLKNWT